MDRVKPIDPRAFASKVVSLLTKEATRTGSPGQSLWPHKVAVCVSGGSDSMALAYLLKHMPHPFIPNSPAFRPICFIVDHGARTGSRDEALTVQNNLAKLNMESHILQMQWPKGINPSQLRGFESDARRKRYRLIAGSAIAEDIKHIYVGHHLDDQVETLLMRLLQTGKKSLLGLQGIAEVSKLPCSDDIFEAQTTYPPEGPTEPTSQTPLGITPFDNIKTHRPLLSFSKEQITATCRNQAIPFVTDETNFDATLTMRNAVRHLRTHHSLPVALGTQRILSIHRSALHYRKCLETEGRQVLDKMKCLRFDKRTGLLELETPFFHKTLSRHEYETFSYALARIVEQLTPEPGENLPTVLNGKVSRSILHPPLSQEVAPIQIERVTFKRLSSSHTQGVMSTLWRVSRQPMRSAEISRNTCSFELESSDTCSRSVRTKWLLWDCRFWIQLIHGIPEALSAVKIKPYSQRDVSMLKDKLVESGKLEAFEEMLRSTAPGQIRYSLPVLTCGDHIIAFPTLDFRVSGHENLQWNVRYPSKSYLPFET